MRAIYRGARPVGKPSQPFSILIGGWVLRLAHKLARHVLQRWKGSACLLPAPDACWVAAFDRRCGPFTEVQDQWASLVSHSPFSLGAGCYGSPTNLPGTCCNAGKALLVRCLRRTLVGSLLLTEGAGHLQRCKTSGQA